MGKRGPKPEPQTLESVTAKEKMLADHYLATGAGFGSARAAGIAAGYAPAHAASTVQKILKKARVARYIAAQRQRLADLAGIDRPFLLTETLAVYQEARAGRPLVSADGTVVTEKDPEGIERVVRIPDTAGALKALDLLGRAVGIFVEKHELRGAVAVASVPVPPDVALDQFMRLVQQHAPALETDNLAVLPRDNCQIEAKKS